MWSTHSSFLPLVTASWSLPVMANNPIHRVTQKLKHLKVTLKAWNRDTFRNVYVVMEEAVEALNAVQAEAAILGDMNDRLLAEDGDRNTKFFHTMNRVRKTSFGLTSLIINGVLFFNSDSISNSVVEFFSDLFANRDLGSYDDSVLGDFIQPVVDSADNDSLSCIPSVEEIKRAVFDMEPSSAPGPDGFGGTFYHSCWDIISLDIIEAVRYFFNTRHIPFSLNSSFVTLILKKLGANRVEDFRLIVMGNYLFKIFTKIVASRLGITKAPRYLLYADDILNFAKATPSNIRHLHHIISAYGGLSGQLYNPTKSKVYFGSAVPRRVKTTMLWLIGISEGALPFTYLGVPIFRGAPRTCYLAAMADSIIAKFSKWKGHALSMAGRKCMINSIIAASLV
ncbi:hypothetical protein ACS0TY_018326 [Phlomoides rotata]